MKKHGSSAFGSPRARCSMDLVHPRRLWQLHLLLQFWQGMHCASYVQVMREKHRLRGRLVLPFFRVDLQAMCSLDAVAARSRLKSGACSKTSEILGFGLNVKKEFLTKATWSPAGA